MTPPPITGPGNPRPRASIALPLAWFRQSDTADTLKAFFLGLVTTAVFYEIYPIPFMETGRLLAVFDNWASELIVFMTLWCVWLLLFKQLTHRRQQRIHLALTGKEMWSSLERAMEERDVEPAIETLSSQLKRLKLKGVATSLAFQRVATALRTAPTLREKDPLISSLSSEAEIENRRLEGSFTILQVFIWAIPILGFIGTVHGIGTAVSEFSEFIRTAEGGAGLSTQMRTALAGVTGGLALAFNTTFLALVMVIPVMLLTSLLQKSQEELLLAIEGFVLERLVPRLRLEASGIATLQDYEAQLQRVLETSSQWAMQMEPMVNQFGRQAEMLSHQMAGVQPLVKTFTDRVLGTGAPEVPPSADRMTPRDGD